MRDLAHVADLVARRRRLEVGVEHLVVGSAACSSNPCDLLRAPVVAGVRVDGDELDARGRGAGQHDRRSAPEAADLDDPRRLASPHEAQSHSRRAWSGVIQPSTSATAATASSKLVGAAVGTVVLPGGGDGREQATRHRDGRNGDRDHRGRAARRTPAAGGRRWTRRRWRATPHPAGTEVRSARRAPGATIPVQSPVGHPTP